MSSLSTRSMVVGLIIGLVIGAGVGSIVSPGVTDISELEQQIASLQTQISNKDDEIESLETQLALAGGTDISDLELQIASLQTQIINKEDEIKTLNTQLSNIQTDISSMQSQIILLQDELDEKDVEINELGVTILELESKVPASPPTEGEPGSSMFFPADIGTPVVSTFHSWLGDFTAEITILEVIRGDSAHQIIIDATDFFYPPIEGFEHMLVKIKFKIISASAPDDDFEVYDTLFISLASDGFVYPETDVGTRTFGPEPQLLFIDLFENQYAEGWGVYHVNETDTEPLLRFDYGNIYFKLYG